MTVKTLLLSLAIALPCAADELVLKNGAAFSGAVREEGDKVVIELDFGTMTFRKSEVRSFKKTSDPIQEYERKLQGATDAKSTYEVAVWAREKGLGTRANDLLRKVVSLDPDHAGARRALGFEKVDGKWLEGDDLMTARGLLKHNGRWLPKDTVEKIHENEKQIHIEAERRETAERIARLHCEVELAKVQLERERLEKERLERERLETESWRWGVWTSHGYRWPNYNYSRHVLTIPPPLQGERQPPPVIIQGVCPPTPRVPARP